MGVHMLWTACIYCGDMLWTTPTHHMSCGWRHVVGDVFFVLSTTCAGVLHNMHVLWGHVVEWFEFYRCCSFCLVHYYHYCYFVLMWFVRRHWFNTDVKTKLCPELCLFWCALFRAVSLVCFTFIVCFVLIDRLLWGGFMNATWITLGSLGFSP